MAVAGARRDHGEGPVVLFGRSDEGLGVPYQPFVEALSTYVRQTPMPALGRLAGELVRLVPDVTERVDGLPPPLRSDPETERYRLFDAVAAWLAAASETAPVVLVVDDLHWATRATLFLLRHLVRSAEQLRLLVVVTYRDTEPDFAPEAADATVDLLRRPGVARLALCGLDEAGVEAFMESRARHELDDDARALARAVHGETAGNPFFVGQVFRHLAETGAVVRQAGRWVAGQPDAEIPDDVRDVVGRAAADGDVEAGVRYATRAGDRAMAQLAHGEAALYYQQALELWERTDAPPDQPRRLDLLISLGEAQRGAGDVAYRHTLFEAARLAQDRGDGPA